VERSEHNNSFKRRRAKRVPLTQALCDEPVVHGTEGRDVNIESVPRQCWGRHGAFYLKRCGRRITHRYCDDHRPQWLVLPILLLISVLAVVSDFGQVAQFLNPESVQEIELRRDAYTRISLVAHSWKNVYQSLHPKGFNAGASASGKNLNVWERLATSDIPTYSRESWIKFYPLFNEHLENVRGDLQDAQAAYADILDPSTRSLIERTRTQLTADRTVYYWLPRGGLGEYTPSSFQGLFAEVFRTLGKLDTEVQRMRDELPRD
jgi:hypothetical protein